MRLAEACRELVGEGCRGDAAVKHALVHGLPARNIFSVRLSTGTNDDIDYTIKRHRLIKVGDE
jgi:hypothetical protein